MQKSLLIRLLFLGDDYNAIAYPALMFTVYLMIFAYLYSLYR